MVHRREIEGRAVVFGNQGDLWRNAMTWFDHDTGSVWSQPTGEAIMGPLAGTTLELLPSSLTSWADWHERFPDTRALEAATRSNPFSLDQMAVVTVVGDESVAIPITELRRFEAVSLEIGDEPVIVTLDPDVDRWAAYSRERDGLVLDLELIGDALVDPVSGGEWDAALGSSRDGDEPLDRVSVFSSFPLDYPRLFPDGRVWIDGELLPATVLGPG